MQYIKDMTSSGLKKIFLPCYGELQKLIQVHWELIWEVSLALQGINEKKAQ